MKEYYDLRAPEYDEWRDAAARDRPGWREERGGIAAEVVVGDGLALPFDDASFDRVFASYFYCHLEEDDAAQFRAETRRVAGEVLHAGTWFVLIRA